jgi:hypothetical protein
MLKNILAEKYTTFFWPRKDLIVLMLSSTTIICDDHQDECCESVVKVLRLTGRLRPLRKFDTLLTVLAVE